MLSAWVLASVLAAAGGPADGGGVLPSGTRSDDTPAVREPAPVTPGSAGGAPRTDNGAAPPAKDKTTQPRDVDRGGTPRAQGREALPNSLSDVPISPPVAPPAEGKPNKTGGGAEKAPDIHHDDPAPHAPSP